jgi:CTP:phosphocholine cytidylyltransferase-like protein
MPPVDNAVILAAGFGSRFVPLTFETPKALIPVFGVPMIERQILQLIKKGITEITVVTGYLKEQFEYLRDKFNVKLVYNHEYDMKNNLSSLYSASDYLHNTYILSADNWIRENIFNEYEEKSWYSCVFAEGATKEWCVQTDKTGRINNVAVGGKNSWVMYGPVFFTGEFSEKIKPLLKEYYFRNGTSNWYWENVFIENNDDFDLYINKQDSSNIYEFECLDELRLFDSEYGNNTKNKCLTVISEVFDVKESEITRCSSVKSGMTNKSFSFVVRKESYIYRHAGEGSNTLLKRNHEKNVYEAVIPLGISDEIIYFDIHGGEKISRFYNGAINTDPRNKADVSGAMALLRSFHAKGLNVGHSFNVFAEIERYISLCLEKNISISKYKTVFEKLKPLNEKILNLKINNVLCHVDCNPDNFIRLKNGEIKIIDWEYAGMADPIIDIAMYSIYSYYTKVEALELLEIYLENKASETEIMRLDAYMSLGGLLWALWTEYKKSFGIEFSDYGERMFDYAKQY